MIEIHDERAGDIAVIHAVPAGHYQRPLPTVFFCHGYTSSKEVYAYFAYALARAGFRVVLPDADRHGERFDGDEARRLATFWGDPAQQYRRAAADQSAFRAARPDCRRAYRRRRCLYGGA